MKRTSCKQGERNPAAFAILLLAAVAGVAVARAQDRAGQSECLSNLKQYSLGILMYQQDYDERYPPMKMPVQVQGRVNPYVKNRSVFFCPVTRTDYLPNPALNYLYLKKVTSPASTIMLRDAKPHPSDSGKPFWNVAYADGHVKATMSEPKLGKPAPTPPTLTAAQRRRQELENLRATKRDVNNRIRALENQERRRRR